MSRTRYWAAILGTVLLAMMFGVLLAELFPAHWIWGGYTLVSWRGGTAYVGYPPAGALVATALAVLTVATLQQHAGGESS